MKKSILISALAIATLLPFSCKKKEETKVTETTNANQPVTPVTPVDPRDAYTGTYSVVDTLVYNYPGAPQPIVSNYVLQVTKGNTKKDTIYLNNLSNGGKNILALMAGTLISIPTQSIAASSSMEYISGFGSLNGSKIGYNTSQNLPGASKTNKGLGTKQ